MYSYPSCKRAPVVSRVWAHLKQRGVWWVCKVGWNIAARRPHYLWHRAFARGRTFEFAGKTYRYLYHPHNWTSWNERSVELPIVWDAVQSRAGGRILEVGNVLSHYFEVKHDIIDKYEPAAGVTNVDIVDFQPAGQYDLIVSISTLEHVGWDEEPREPMKPLRALAVLRGLLAPGGKLMVTVRTGQNPHLDALLRAGEVGFTEQHCMRRVPCSTRWRQVEPDDLPSGTLVIGVITHDGHDGN